MSKKPLKTSYQIATENFKPVQDGSNALELLGTENLPRQDPRDEFATFLQVFGKKNSFYYIAQLVCPHDDNITEIGIGHLHTSRGKTFLVRESQVATFEEDNPLTNFGSLHKFEERDHEQVLTVRSYNPPSTDAVLEEPNSLLVSHKDGPPCPVKIENNSVLVCVNNKLVSVTLEELAGLLKRYL